MPQILFHKFSLMLFIISTQIWQNWVKNVDFWIFGHHDRRFLLIYEIHGPPWKLMIFSVLGVKKCGESDSVKKIIVCRAKKKFLTNYRKKNVFLAFCSLKLFSFKPKCINATINLSQLVESFHLIPLLSFYLQN